MHTKTTDYRHRTCHVCGKDWNVSAKADSGKHYTCPRCRAGKKTGGARNAGYAANQGHLNKESL